MNESLRHDGDVDWTIIFHIREEKSYMTIPAQSEEDALAIFREWMFGESGQLDWDTTSNKVWRQLDDTTTFRNDWVIAYEVLPRNFQIKN